MKVELKISDKSKKLIRKMPEAVRPALFSGMKEAMRLVERRVKSPYLSGKALRRRTGRLRNSVFPQVKIQGDKVLGTIGTNVLYGRFWELGFVGGVQVRAHERLIAQAFGKSIAPRRIRVRAHSRQIDQEARPFLRPAMEDELSAVTRLLGSRIEEAFR